MISIRVTLAASLSIVTFIRSVEAASARDFVTGSPITPNISSPQRGRPCFWLHLIFQHWINNWKNHHWYFTLCVGLQKNPSCCAFKMMTMKILTKGQAEAQQSAACCKCWQTSIKSAATPSLDCRAGILWQILRLKNQAHYHLLQQQHETSWQKKAQIKIESMQWNPPIVPNQSVGKIFLIDPLVLECRVGKVHDKVLRSPHRVDLSWSIKFAEIQNGPLTQLCLQMHYEINQSKVILKNVSMCQFWRPHPKHHISIHLEFGKWAHQLQDLPQARALPSVLLFVPVKPILAQPRDFGQQIFWLFTFFNLYMILWM